MIAPPLPLDEHSRLERLRVLGLLDREPIDQLDRLTRLITRHFSLPIAMVSLTDVNRQWFLARTGVALCEISREHSFCGHAILRPDIMQVPDARIDPRFADNPLVVGEPHVRLYACVPLITPEGAALGTLAVLDTVPRALTDEQLEGLKILAGQVMVLLELRRQQRLLSQLVQERDQMHAELVDQSETLRVAGSIARIGGWSLELPARQLNWSQEIVDTFGLAGRTGPVAQILALHTPPYRPALEQARGRAGRPACAGVFQRFLEFLCSNRLNASLKTSSAMTISVVASRRLSSAWPAAKMLWC